MIQLPDGYVGVVSPKGKQDIGYLRTSDGRRRLHMNGGIYEADEMAAKGYFFVPLVAMTPERIAAIEYFVEHFGSWNGNDDVAYHTGILSKMLNANAAP